VDDHALASRLLSAKPKQVVLVGEPVSRLKATLVDLLSDETNSAPPPQVFAFDSIERFIDAAGQVGPDSALCLHLPNDADKPEKVLGAACRLSPSLVLVEHSNSASASALYADEQFFAFGFRRVGQLQGVSGLQQQWYAYSLRDYKQSPEWLNARFWAHPERFDLQD